VTTVLNDVLLHDCVRTTRTDDEPPGTAPAPGPPRPAHAAPFRLEDLARALRIRPRAGRHVSAASGTRHRGGGRTRAAAPSGS